MNSKIENIPMITDQPVQTITLSDIKQPGFFDSVMSPDNHYKRYNLILQDGSVILDRANLIFNCIMFRVYFRHGVDPAIDDVVIYKTILADTFNNTANHVYARLIEKIYGIKGTGELIVTEDYGDKLVTGHDLDDLKLRMSKLPQFMWLVDSIWLAIHEIYNFAFKYCGAYHRSISLIGMCKLIHNNPEVSELVETELDPKYGTKVAETKLKEMNSNLCKLLATRGALEDNCLLPFMQTKCLKDRSIPQMILAYGCRSDIDDKMMSHIINESCLSGCKSIKDYAVESLSAKKSAYLNKMVIRETQYFNRRLRLTCSSLIHIHRGWCGSTLTLPITIKDAWAKNFIDKIIIDNGEKVLLTKENINKYVGKIVNMISPLGCRHTDGVCETCAGRGQQSIYYYTPPNIHIGLLVASKVGSRVSQNVLSNKHLINTITMLFALNPLAKRYFTVVDDSILFNAAWKKKLKGLKLSIPMSALGPISDLNYPDILPRSESYSEITSIMLLKNDMLLDELDINYQPFVPFLSDSILNYIRNNFNKTGYVTQDVKNKLVIIDLSDFDSSQPVFKYLMINDDIVKFAKSIEKFLNNNIAKYSSASLALQDFMNILYKRLSVNPFVLEMILKAFLITSPSNYDIPIVTDLNNVQFGTMRDVITKRSLSMKLSFERLNDYFKDPITSLKPRTGGLFAKWFGLDIEE